MDTDKTAWEAVEIMSFAEGVEGGCDKIKRHMLKIGYNDGATINNISAEEYDDLIDTAKSMIVFLEHLKSKKG